MADSRKPLSEATFRRLSAWSKGYTVYMLGARDDEPNVPESYTPTARERVQYERGQAMAVQHAQDGEE